MNVLCFLEQVKDADRGDDEFYIPARHKRSRLNGDKATVEVATGHECLITRMGRPSVEFHICILYGGGKEVSPPIMSRYDVNIMVCKRCHCDIYDIYCHGGKFKSVSTLK